MKLTMSKDEFSRIITERLNLAPAILAGKIVTEVEFPDKYASRDTVEITFGEPSERYIEPAPRPVPVPALPRNEDELDPF